MPSPLPRQVGGSCSLILLPPHRPSPSPRRVGTCIMNFEACSAFTHVTACTLAESPSRPSSIGGFSSFVTSTAAPIATGRNEPVPGWDLHPLWTKRLSRRTRTIPLAIVICVPEMGQLMRTAGFSLIGANFRQTTPSATSKGRCPTRPCKILHTNLYTWSCEEPFSAQRVTLGVGGCYGVKH
jgi:hypothetical protein